MRVDNCRAAFYTFVEHDFTRLGARALEDDSSAAADKSGSSYSITALSRAIAVLNAFTAERPELGLNDLVTATGLPKTTTFRLLSALMEHDFVALDSVSGKYSLGFALLRLGEIRRGQTNAHGTVMPVMQDIRRELNETIVFSIRVGDERVHVDALESKQLLRRTAEIGGRAPLHAGASSKVLLAGMSDTEIENYIERNEPLFGPGGEPMGSEALYKEIAQIRANGFAESRGEVRPGGGALAAPVRDFSGAWLASIDVLTPNERYTPEHRERVLAVLLEGVARASERLGYRGG